MSERTPTGGPGLDDRDGYATTYGAQERRRLDRQDSLLAPYTGFFFGSAGLEPGMRVLEIGCGIGSLTATLAAMVGPEGHVTGVDLNTGALRSARDTLAASGVSNVDLVECDIDEFEPTGRYDALVGRLVLLFLPDPASSVRRLSAYVRPGGIVAFQETVNSRAHAVPPVASFSRAREYLRAGFLQSGIDEDFGLSLPRVLREAGFPKVDLLTGALAFQDWELVADFMRTGLPVLRPAIVASGAARATDIDGLPDEVAVEGTSLQATAFLSDLVFARAVVPPSEE